MSTYFTSFPFDFECGLWDVIVLILEHCSSVTMLTSFFFLNFGLCCSEDYYFSSIYTSDSQHAMEQGRPIDLLSLLILSAGYGIRARGYKTFFMLNSIEHEIFPAHKC